MVGFQALVGVKPSDIYLPFEDTVKFAHGLGLRSEGEWEAWRKTGAVPTNIPFSPDHVYKHSGWQGWEYFLGATSNPSAEHGNGAYLPFVQALTFARSLQLLTHGDWDEWCTSGVRPSDIPAAPHQVYHLTGWQGMVHWLGSGSMSKGSKNVQRRFLPFDEARTFARSLNLTDTRSWELWRKSGARPANIPSTPSRFYKDSGWQGYGHWLGTGNISTKPRQPFLPFATALVFAQSLNLKTVKEWEGWYVHLHDA